MGPRVLLSLDLQQEPPEATWNVKGIHKIWRELVIKTVGDCCHNVGQFGMLCLGEAESCLFILVVTDERVMDGNQF